MSEDDNIFDLGERLRERLRTTADDEVTVEDSIALNFALMHEENLRYVAAWSKWILWEERRWLEDNTLVAFDLVRQECRKIRNYLSPNERK
jgi:D5-like protein